MRLLENFTCYKKFGKPPFLIHQIVKEEPTEDIPALKIGIINASI